MVTALLIAGTASAADPDLSRAGALVREGKYEAAFELLAPFEGARSGDPEFAYLLGRAALGTKRAEKARSLLERSLAARPGSAAAHLALGRAYYALGRYAEAKIEFETVIRFGNLPADLESQVRIYAESAEQNQEQGKRLTGFGYAETGIGYYRVNSTRGTNTFGGGDRRDTFYNARVGGGLNYALEGDDALDAGLDYRFRYYDNPDTRNDGDVRWRAAASRALGEDNVAIGVRGRVSYRGTGTFRNDYSVFGNYRHRLDANNQLSAGAELQRRRYPSGNLRDRSRTTATATAGWTHSFADGRTSVSLTGHVGYNHATSRPDGESAIYGATGSLDFTLAERLGGFMFVWWERDAFNADRVHYHPDAIDRSAILRRKDNLYEIGGGLVWEFAKGWSLRPEILYIRDQSNAVAFNYSSTEVWVNVRKAF